MRRFPKRKGTTDRTNPLDRSYLLNREWKYGRLVCGCYPFSRVQELIEFWGIDVFVDLTEGGERSWVVGNIKPYTPDLPEGVEHISIPMPNGTAATQEWLHLVADTIHDHMKQNQTIYLHCHAGVGRTGMAALAYLIKWRGLLWDSAREHIQRQRIIMFNSFTEMGMNEGLHGFRPSPRKAPQLDAVWVFYCSIRNIQKPRVKITQFSSVGD